MVKGKTQHDYPVSSTKGFNKLIFDQVNFGKRIKKLRKDWNFTQEKLAEQLDISVDFLQKIETAHRNCSIDVLLKIAAFFDVSTDYLILGEDFSRENSKRMILEIADQLIAVAKSL